MIALLELDRRSPHGVAVPSGAAEVVGVIDVQSTRVNDYTSTIARCSADSQPVLLWRSTCRLYSRVQRNIRTLRPLSAISKRDLVHSGSGRAGLPSFREPA